MNQTKWTAGEIEYGHGGEGRCDILEGQRRVCTIYFRADQPTAASAAIGLIASAPELVEALRECRLWLDTIGRALCQQVLPSNKAAQCAEQVERIEAQTRAVLSKAGA